MLLAKKDVLIEPHPTFRLLGKTLAEQRAAYRQLFAEALDGQVVERIRDITNASQVLGNDRFIDQVEAMLGRRVRPKKRGRPKVKPGD
jgi:putative transposase